MLESVLVFLQNVFRFFCFFPIDFMYKVVFRSHAIGVENIPKTGGAMIAANHISGWDVFIVPYFALNRFSSRQMWAPAKIELFKFPPMAWTLHAMRAFPVHRGQHDYSAMDRSIRIMREHLIMLFPEGTRSKDGKLGRGRPGVGRIIYEAKSPVIPTLIINTNYCVIPGLFMLNLFQKLYVVYGKPLDLQRFYDMPNCKETSQMIAEAVMDEIAGMREEYKHLDHAPAWVKKRVEDKYRRYAEKRAAGKGKGADSRG